MDSTTISLFSNVLFKGVERNPKSGKKKGGLKVHTVIHANEGVPFDIKITSAATHDHFNSFFEQPEKGWNLLIESKAQSPPMQTLFD